MPDNPDSLNNTVRTPMLNVKTACDFYFDARQTGKKNPLRADWGGRFSNSKGMLTSRTKKILFELMGGTFQQLEEDVLGSDF